MKLKQIPNLFTAFRFFSIPVLWFLALFQEKFIFACLFFVSGLTDGFDGFTARLFNSTSKFGAKFDSVSDDLIGASSIFWVYLLVPEIIFENFAVFIFLLVLFFLNYLIRLITQKRFHIPFHLISDKAGALISFLFLSHALFFGYNQIFFYITALSIAVMNIEEILLCLTRKKIDEKIKSIFLR